MDVWESCRLIVKVGRVCYLFKLQVTCLDSTPLNYLVLVTGCISIGRILEVEICRVTQVTLISLVTSTTQQSEQVTDVVKFLSSGAFFFSYPSNSLKFQLSSSAQCRYVNSNKSPHYFLWLVVIGLNKPIKLCYCRNRALMVPFQQYGINYSRWLLQLMCGSVEVKTLYCGRHQAKACLISRFGCERAGTRFSMRGIDDDGYVAGFFETEQVIATCYNYSNYYNFTVSLL